VLGAGRYPAGSLLPEATFGFASCQSAYLEV
jgi:hypothetical protein